MNNSYRKALSKLEIAKSDIESLWNEGQKSNNKSFEDKQANRILENIIEEIDTSAYKLKRFTMPVIEGTLREADNGKFELYDDNGKYVTYFSCGSPIECYLYDDYEESNVWYPGRVEHKSENGVKGYYFVGPDNPYLYNGMKARIRQG